MEAVQVRDVIQVRAQQEPVVVGHAPLQRLAQCRDLPAQPPAGQIGQLPRIGLPGDQRLQHISARDPQDVCRHAGQLDVSVLQHLLDAVGRGSPLLEQLRPLPRQVAQLADRLRWHEAGLEQPVL